MCQLLEAFSIVKMSLLDTENILGTLDRVNKRLSEEQETTEKLRNQLIKCEIKKREFTEKFVSKEAEAKQLYDDLATANEKIKLLSDQGSQEILVLGHNYQLKPNFGPKFSLTKLVSCEPWFCRGYLYEQATDEKLQDEENSPKE